MPIVTSLLKASALTALFFALAWVRLPITASLLGSLVDFFILSGIILVVLSLLVGVPSIVIAEKLGIGRWWFYSLIAAATGALFAAVLGYREVTEVSNPHGGLVLSPLTSDHPGTNRFPESRVEYVSSIVFCSMLGAAMGFAFSRFYSRHRRPGTLAERSRER